MVSRCGGGPGACVYVLRGSPAWQAQQAQQALSSANLCCAGCPDLEPRTFPAAHPVSPAPPPPLPVCSTHFCHPSAPQTWVLALFRALQQLQPLAAQGPADRRLLSAREAPF